MTVKQNKIFTNQGKLRNIFYSNESSFYDVSSISTNRLLRPSPESLYKVEMYLDIMIASNYRDAYTILDILGKIGGIEKSLKSFLAIFFLLLSKIALKDEFCKHLLLLKRKEAKHFSNENLKGN